MTSILEQMAPSGLKILDIGGGDSRVLKAFTEKHECWNLDKLEGIGNGPTNIEKTGYRLVKDYIREFSTELPDNYFDVVFSISTLEHVNQNDRALFDRIVRDIDRVLKSGGLSMQLFDIVVKHGLSWCNPLAPYMFFQMDTLNKLASVVTMKNDPDAYSMSEQAYNSFWKPHTKKPYESHGKPMSLNVFWRK